MKGVIKKLSGMFLIIAVLLCGLFIWNDSTYAATTVVSSGTHGIDTVKWTLYSDGALKITGTGTIRVYKYEIPWEAYVDRIVSITIEDGVTYTGSLNYQQYDSLKWIKNNGSEPYELGNDQSMLFVDATGNAVKEISGGSTAYRRLKPYGADVVRSMDIAVGTQMKFLYKPIYFSYITDAAGLATIKDFVFTSSDESVLTVNDNGMMTAKKVGTVTVTVTPRYDKTSWFVGNVSTTVNVKNVSDVSIIVKDNIVYQLNSDGTATLADGRWSASECTIPSTVVHNNKTYSVTQIGNKAFSGHADLKHVNFPDSLITIGDYAFENCSSLADIVLPKKLETIKIGGFFMCTEISSIEFPASVTYVGQNTFLGSKLKTIYIPATLTRFNYLALNEIETLESVTVEAGNPYCKSIDGVLYINDVHGWGLAKYPAARKGEVFEIDSSAVCVYMCAIEENKYLKKVIFPAGMKGENIGIIQDAHGGSYVEEFGVAAGNPYITVKDGVLYSKDGKTLYMYPPMKKDKVFIIPEGVEVCEVIAEPQLLEELYIPSSVKVFGGIEYAKELKKVVFSKNSQITKLPEHCFQSCEKLESICLPKSMVKFSDTWFGNEFFECFALKTLYIAQGAPYYTSGTWGSQTTSGCNELIIYGYGTGNKLSQMASEMAREYVNIAGGTDKVLGVTFENTEITLKKGTNKNINAFVYPETTTSKTLQYTSSNTKVATVSATGVVKAVSNGSCYIIAKATDGSGEYARCLVNVGPADGMDKAADGKWYYYTGGKINTSYTGMASNVYGWWYIKNGELDFTYTGMAKNAYGWWYMKNGKLDRTYTGMAKNAYGWWYMKNGQLDKSYTGMAKNAYGWWYMKNGKLDTTYMGMAKNQYGWWYMKNGKLDNTYTGIAQNAYGNWYMKKGKLDTSFSGKVTLNGKNYTIKNGKVV